MAKYGTFIYGDGTLYGEGAVIFPIEGLTRVPWIFKNTATGDEYEFAINPVDASVPAVEKAITTQYTASGKPVNWEGRRAPQKITFSGTILTEAHFYAMKDWYELKTQINLSDDLSRKYWVIITAFNPTRNYSPQYPWRHEYSAEATILDWA